ncbi:MAG TPA: helix-turn-helix domain-containing protein [Beijerinckiaceae bacterium]|jgi:AraC-like DNA-binding protein|nr:helix-turn-helix domain-containing protein [Beijerinckiaceae bacterium]
MEFTTDGLAARDTLHYWSATVLKRMGVERAVSASKPFQARLRRSLSPSGEFWDHYSDTLYVDRSRERCARDGGEEIYVGLIVDGFSNLEFGDQRLALRPGDIYVVDFREPVRAEWLPHRELGLLINRQHVIDRLGQTTRTKPREAFRSRSGFTALFASHLRLLANEARHLSADEQSDVIEVAIQLALLMLRSEPVAPEKLDGTAFMAAARRLIAERLSDPDLTPDQIAAALRCSRATLYRHFERDGAGVVETIRDCRLDSVRDMLIDEPLASISDLAFRCGFLDQSSFNKMFKRRFGMAPGQVRDGGEPAARTSLHSRR